MGLGLLFGAASAVYHIVTALFFDFASNDWRDFWIMAGAVLVAAVVLGFATRVSAFFPRLLVGFCITASPGALAGAVISLFTGQGRYAVPLFVLAATTIGALVICVRIMRPEYEVWLSGNRKVDLSGDLIERVPTGGDGYKSKDAKYAPYSVGDLLVWSGARVVAWYRKDDVVGYNEVDMPTVA